MTDKPTEYVHDTCPVCGERALYGTILAPLVITSTGSDDYKEIGKGEQLMHCPKGHIFPMLWIIRGESI